jgi:hypothetical protein
MPTITNQKVDSMRKDGTAIKVGSDWYSAYKGMGLNGVAWGDTVTFDFQQKGQFNNIKGNVEVVAKNGTERAVAAPQSTASAGTSGTVTSQARNAGVEVGHAWNSAVQIALTQSNDPQTILRIASDLAPRVYSICSAFRDMAAVGDMNLNDPYSFSDQVPEPLPDHPVLTEALNIAPGPDLSSIAGEDL